jgi:multicomponent Na+:H+ antiporter subunit C
MSLSLVFAVGGLVAIGVYLVSSRALSRVVLGFAMLGHAAVLALVASGGRAGEPPLADQNPAADISDPLPQALSLTAIVISFGLTLYLLALANRQRELTDDDRVEDDLEDARVARQHDRFEPVEEVADEFAGDDIADRGVDRSADVSAIDGRGESEAGR